MKHELLKVLICPKCHSNLDISDEKLECDEVNEAKLICSNDHVFQVTKGIVQMMSHADNEFVKKELAYEEETYQGNEKLFDLNIIKRYPESLSEIWPGNIHFGFNFKEMVNFLNLKEDSLVADIGCGSSWSSRILAQKGVNTVCTDINLSDYCGLGTARIFHKEYNVYYDRIQESMTVLPFKDSTFDCILFNASFHHSPDIDLTLKECRRALKDKGKIAMINESFIGLRHKITGIPEHNEDGSHRDIPWKEFKYILRKNNLKAEYHLAPHVDRKVNSKFLLKIFKPILKLPYIIRLMNSSMLVLSKA